MLIPGWAWEVLLDAGVRATQVTDDLITVWSDQRAGKPQLARVRTLKQRRGPKEVQRLVQSAGDDDAVQLLIAPGLTPSEQQQLTAAGWAWLSGPTAHQPTMGNLVLGNDTIRLHSTGPPDTDVHTPRGRTPWGALMLQKQLLTGESFPQSELVRITGLTQPRVSQVLKDLQANRLVGKEGSRQSVRWRCANIDGLLDRWLMSQPGAGGVTTYWMGLRDSDEQVHDACQRLDKAAALHNDFQELAVSGDPAAQQFAPWRTPVRAVIYARVGADLSPAGFVPTGPGEATLEVSVPKDPGVWPTGAVSRLIRRLRPDPPFPLADPFQTLLDIKRIGGPDADQAFDVLRRWLVRDLSLQALS